MRRLFLIAATALLAASAGCGGSSSSNGVVNVTVWHGYQDIEGKAMTSAAARFNATHPKIHVTVTNYGNADYALQKVLTAIRGGAYPDIAYLYGSWAANIARSPTAVDLSSRINEPGVNWNDFWPAERQAVQVGGKVIGMPALVDNLALVYNKKLFDQAGIPYPTANWTWDDFRAAAQKLTDSSAKQFGWAYVADGSEDTVWRFDALLWQAGGDILNSDNTKAEFNSGKIGMLFTGPWDLSSFPNVNYGVQVLPGLDNHQTISGPDQWVLFNNGSQRTQAAWTFLKWFTSPQQALIWSTQTGDLPIRASETQLPGYPAYVKKYPGVSVFVQNEANALKARPVIANYNEVSQAMGQAIEAVLLGKGQPQQELDQAADQANQTLATGQ